MSSGDSYLNGKAHTSNGTQNKRPLTEEDGEKRFFVPAPTWNGSKTGYYFGTADLGTGYYLDSAQQQTNKEAPKTKKARRSVGFAEERNETKLIPTSSELLEEAEAHAAGTKVVALTPSGCKVAATLLRRAIEINALQRCSSGDDTVEATPPEAYMESEVALYEQVQALQAFAADPMTLYPILLEATDIVNDLLQLLLHDNVDIAVAVCAVFVEWLDSDLLTVREKEEETATTVIQRRAAVRAMAALVLDQGGESLVENLGRMSETTSENEDDEVGRGVRDVLSVLENLLEMDALLGTTATMAEGETPPRLTKTELSVGATLCKETALLPWLFEQLDSENSLYRDKSMELLSYLGPVEDVHSVVSDWSRIKRYVTTFSPSSALPSDKENETLDGVELLLLAMSKFKKRQPTTDPEIELVENVGMVLNSVLIFNAKAVQAFLDAQGIQLVLRCLSERVYAGGVALAWLEFNGTDPVYRRAAEEFVRAGALKHIFPIFMGRHLPKYHTGKGRNASAALKKAKKDFKNSTERMSIRILYGLVRHLDDNSPYDAKQRVLAKFLDGPKHKEDVNSSDTDQNEKLNRLIELLFVYDQRTRQAEYKFFRSDLEDSLMDENSKADEAENSDIVQLALLERKLASGGDILHRLAAVTAYLCAHSKQCHSVILNSLNNRESDIGLVRDALGEFVRVLGESKQKVRLTSFLEHI